MKLKHVRALNQILDATFGTQSMSNAGHAVRHKLLTGVDGSTKLEIRFESICNWNPRIGMEMQRKELDAQSIKAINNKITECKKQFREITGESLKIKAEPIEDAIVEHISHNPSLIRAKYYRCNKYTINMSQFDS
tara:strand:- start:168 stop:572 length:405 start_codon:yes stop_codon:yes gene_type:complete